MIDGPYSVERDSVFGFRVVGPELGRGTSATMVSDANDLRDTLNLVFAAGQRSVAQPEPVTPATVDPGAVPERYVDAVAKAILASDTELAVGLAHYVARRYIVAFRAYQACLIADHQAGRLPSEEAPNAESDGECWPKPPLIPSRYVILAGKQSLARSIENPSYGQRAIECWRAMLTKWAEEVGKEL